ncbi:DUF7064 domain-containing protein [Novosphingopyxis sp.]|uniref:DUF7064 domain-containing protein n=1 Tax=Novosphingopyxis sp. TaxID=2709690 RepID=UPI003B5BDEA9
MIVPDGMTLRLDPQDEYTHEPEPVRNYNESMYFNAMDHKSGVGLWVRIGNRVNEGHAEMTCCVYLPGNRVGFLFRRVEITHNREMAAGGMRFEVVRPLETLTVTYDGDVLLMADATDMLDPKRAFGNNPKVACRIALEFTGVSPVYGGEIVNMDGSSWNLDPEKETLRGHIEQHMTVTGTIRVGEEDYVIDGHGYRDKSWGPRHWDNFYWYKWQNVTFSPDFGMMMTIRGRADGDPVIYGHVLRDGKLEHLTDVFTQTEYSDGYYPKRIVTRLVTEKRKYVLVGDMDTVIPLRHRRTKPDGTTSHARITEAIMRYRCEGMEAFGMSENFDMIKDSVPLSVTLVAACTEDRLPE